MEPEAGDRRIAGLFRLGALTKRSVLLCTLAVTRPGVAFRDGGDLPRNAAQLTALPRNGVNMISSKPGRVTLFPAKPVSRPAEAPLPRPAEAPTRTPVTRPEPTADRPGSSPISNFGMSAEAGSGTFEGASAGMEQAVMEKVRMTGAWITRLAEDERKRDDVRLRAAEVEARQAELVRLHGQRLFDELRTTLVRDIEAFRDEFPGDSAHEIVFDAVHGGSFVVRKPQSPTAILTLTPHLSAASVSCEYRFTSPNGMPARNDRFEFIFTSAADNTLQIKQQSTGQVFTNADALSEYLLIPVFTGRPR